MKLVIEIDEDIYKLCKSLPQGYRDRCIANGTPLKDGHWYFDKNRGATGTYAICSNCEESIYQTGKFNYCPNCGADMRGDDNG